MKAFVDSLVAEFKAKPAVYIGFALTVVALVAQQLLANGIVTSAQGVNWLNFIIGLAPALGGLLSHTQFNNPA